jgi:circadian clock protein KaiC
MELGETIRLIQDEVERVKPARVVFDSLSEMRLLAQDPLRYRRQVLALKQFFAGRESTVILVDDMTGASDTRDAHLHSLCHGVITLERLTLDFGAARRRMQVQKLRGVDFTAGFHDLVIRKGGVDIFPRLIASDHHTSFVGDPVPSGIGELDDLLAGGPLRGTSTLLTGPAGSGKTTIALQYLHAACERGEPCTIFEFDERVGTLMARAKAFGLDIVSHVEEGRLTIQQNDPAEISPGEFAARVRYEVEQRGVRMIVIDSLNGYMAAMPQEQQLLLQMHELLSYLNQQGWSPSSSIRRAGWWARWRPISTSPMWPMRWCFCASSKCRGASARRSRCSRTGAAAMRMRSASSASMAGACALAIRWSISAAC